MSFFTEELAGVGAAHGLRASLGISRYSVGAAPRTSTVPQKHESTISRAGSFVCADSGEAVHGTLVRPTLLPRITPQNDEPRPLAAEPTGEGAQDGGSWRI